MCGPCTDGLYAQVMVEEDSKQSKLCAHIKVIILNDATLKASSFNMVYIDRIIQIVSSCEREASKEKDTECSQTECPIQVMKVNDATGSDTVPLREQNIGLMEERRSIQRKHFHTMEYKKEIHCHVLGWKQNQPNQRAPNTVDPSADAAVVEASCVT